jgi:tetratricopeptide (TPR) repeat protein
MTSILKRLSAALLLLALCGAAAGAKEGGEARELIRRGNELYARAEYEAAIAVYARVPEGAGEEYAQALYNVGVCRYELWQTEEAVGFYRRAVAARGGRYPKASYALGVALEDLGRAAEAKAAYTLIAGGYAPAHYRLGLLAAREGDEARAVIHFREAIRQSNDKFPASRNNLGVMLARAGRLAEAEREFEAALRQSGGDFEEATHNLKLCRVLLSGRDSVGGLRLSTAGGGI